MIILFKKFEAGLVLTGWEVKSLRSGNAQLVDSYIFLKDGEAWLIGAHIEPLKNASTHVIAEPTQYRKLLLSQKELSNFLWPLSKKALLVLLCLCIGKNT